ncbi:hypothetical protein FHW36_10677 [Chitinophaga polysaccharea]|uniref:Uncharacterized protein n=1 Tax=Chitinophaga polysaccharea TaxID=1293035 RepID=A0A561PL66_9BACT|nr:hypothetical protein [Chitinophaga polysaccharea]TWF38854.1 hypothetical protein FHW36_10677 [Chitinophaga polysaccharea]
MPCELTQSLTQDCKDSIGGVSEVMAIEFDNVESITETAGVISAIVLATGKQFRKYSMPKDTAFFTDVPTANVQNGTIFYQQEVTIVFNKMRTNVRNELLLLAQNRLIFIIKDKNGTYWLLGKKNALDLTGGEGGTGTASGDRNGYTRVFTGQEPQMAVEVQSTLIAALLLPAA